KAEQADLIVQVEKAREKNELAKKARSFNPEAGKRGGSTKDSFKEKVVEEANKHGISKRTVEKAIAKEKGPTQKVEREKVAEPKKKPAERNVIDIVRKVVKILERDMQGATVEEFKTLRLLLDEFMNDRYKVPRKHDDYREKYDELLKEFTQMHQT